MLSYIKNFLFIVMMLFFTQVSAINLSNIQISNTKNKAYITFSFIENPRYKLLQLNKQSMILDFEQKSIINGLPIQFSGINIIRNIRSIILKNNYLRILVNFTKKSRIRTIKYKNGVNYTLMFIIFNDEFFFQSEKVVKKKLEKPRFDKPFLLSIPFKFFISKTSKKYKKKFTKIILFTKEKILHLVEESINGNDNKIIIAVDAGHGGQDSGAIGPTGIREKNITIAIAKKLCNILNEDPMFKGVIVRDGDYFISVISRSNLARKKKANFLVSIHADAALNQNAIGASVWILSKRRMKDEMINWFKKQKKTFKLSKKIDKKLINNYANPYIKRAFFNLKFGHTQQIGYNVATQVIRQLGNIVSLHKRYPEYASFGVLCSPDIPSILVETGFISNFKEERLLANVKYQKKLAEAIYKGLRCYFEKNTT